ncbi:ABC transporter substrate-binding protein [Polynucleobacter sinensis]|uniref:ABC transporter substrate-binding protein n=1 Tax=Polynucleobacter sinensis TaxID=1743157 RepID=UPI000784D73D|nr:ABC transporter substrate-binding protein [Polynucleobacter sinensis]
MKLSKEFLQKIAPTGKLRASINLGNPILANKDAVSGLPVGVSIDLANGFAQRLGLDIELVVFDSAGKSVEAVTNNQADIGFFAIDPLRGEGISFTAPYVLIEGAYLVKENSPLQNNEQVDAKSNRVVVGKGSAYDLYLTREIKSAEIVRAPTSPTVVKVFLEGDYEVAAGVRQQLESDASKTTGLRLLPGRFMVIQQAMGLPKSYGPEALRALKEYVEEMKSSGFVARSLERHGIQGASVAPSE